MFNGYSRLNILKGEDGKRSVALLLYLRHHEPSKQLKLSPLLAEAALTVRIVSMSKRCSHLKSNSLLYNLKLSSYCLGASRNNIACVRASQHGERLRDILSATNVRLRNSRHHEDTLFECLSSLLAK